jgi:hypothetical protein
LYLLEHTTFIHPMIGMSLRTYFWTGGFKSQITDMWTWCRRYNPTSFGLQKTDGDYYYSEKHEISANHTAFEYCSKISFAFYEQGIRCVDGSNERASVATICESTSNVTNADLVRIYFLNLTLLDIKTLA